MKEAKDLSPFTVDRPKTFEFSQVRGNSSAGVRACVRACVRAWVGSCYSLDTNILHTRGSVLYRALYVGLYVAFFLALSLTHTSISK